MILQVPPLLVMLLDATIKEEVLSQDQFFYF